MPRIPKRREEQRLSAPQPQQLLSPSAAGREGRALQGLGQQVSQFGADIGAFQRESRKVKTAGILATTDAQLKRASIDAADEALRIPDADGSKLVSNFDKIYKAKVEAMGLDDLDIDDDTRLRVQGRAGELSNIQVAELSKRSRTKFVASEQGVAEKYLNQALSNVRLSPDIRESSLNSYTDYIEKAKVLFDDTARKNLLSDAPMDFGMAQISGFVDQQRYDDARRVLDTDLAKVFDAKEAADIRKDIDTAETGDLNRELKVESRKRQLDLLRRKKRQDEKGRDILNRLEKAEKAGDDTAVAEIFDEADSAFNDGEITYKLSGLLTKRRDKSFRNSSMKERIELTSRLSSNFTSENLRQVQLDLDTKVENGKMDPRDAAPVANAIFAQRKSEANARRKASMTAAKGILDIEFGESNFFDPLEEDVKAVRDQTYVEFIKRITNNPELMDKKNGLEDAMRGSIAAIKSNFSALPPISGVDPDNLRDREGFKKAWEEIEDKKNAGEIGKQDAIDKKKMLLERVKAFDNEEKLKALRETQDLSPVGPFPDEEDEELFQLLEDVDEEELDDEE